METKLDLFLAAINDHFFHLDPRTAWPLNGPQMNAYFDIAEANDIYERLMQLKEIKTISEIAKLMPSIDMFRLALTHNLIVGLKVSDAMKITDFGAKKRTEYVNFLFEILENLTNDDPFCLNFENKLFSQVEVNNLFKEREFVVVRTKNTQLAIARLIITMNHYVYSLFYDVYMSAGFYIHGPYDVSRLFGENAVLVVREYHNLKPGIWPNENSPFKKMQMFLVYKNIDYKIDFGNSQRVEGSIPDKLIGFAVYADDKKIDFDEFSKLEDLFEKLSTKQANYVDSLNDLEKVRKGAEICYSFFNKLREETTGDSFLDNLDEVFEKFGDKFIIENKKEQKPPVEFWVNLFNPSKEFEI